MLYFPIQYNTIQLNTTQYIQFNTPPHTQDNQQQLYTSLATAIRTNLADVIQAVTTALQDAAQRAPPPPTPTDTTATAAGGGAADRPDTTGAATAGAATAGGVSAADREAMLELMTSVLQGMWRQLSPAIIQGLGMTVEAFGNGSRSVVPVHNMVPQSDVHGMRGFAHGSGGGPIATINTTTTITSGGGGNMGGFGMGVLGGMGGGMSSMGGMGSMGGMYRVSRMPNPPSDEQPLGASNRGTPAGSRGVPGSTTVTTGAMQGTRATGTTRTGTTRQQRTTQRQQAGGAAAVVRSFPLPTHEDTDEEDAQEPADKRHKPTHEEEEGPVAMSTSPPLPPRAMPAVGGTTTTAADTPPVAAPTPTPLPSTAPLTATVPTATAPPPAAAPPHTASTSAASPGKLQAGGSSAPKGGLGKGLGGALPPKRGGVTKRTGGSTTDAARAGVLMIVIATP